MKPVEEAFSSTGFRRVVLPGIVLTVGIHPLLGTALSAAGATYGVGVTVLVVTEILFFGLVATSALQWIYYVYEGFRLPFLTAFAGRANKRKLERKYSECVATKKGRSFDQLNDAERVIVTRLYEYLNDFPTRLGENGSTEYFVDRPTRLGNVIATYELYCQSRYGIDGTYYWQHLLNLASDSARKEFEDLYAFAESLVLTSFGGVVVATLHVGVLIGFGIGDAFGTGVQIQVSRMTSAVLALFGIVAWHLFYRAAISAHRDAAAAFKALIDGVMDKFVTWATSVVVPTDAQARARIETLTEYLKALGGK